MTLWRCPSCGHEVGLNVPASQPPAHECPRQHRKWTRFEIVKEKKR